MKIIIISDSHGNKIGIEKIFNNIEFDYLFYLGDGLNDLGDYIYLDNVFAVSGNCDFFSNIHNEREFYIKDIKFLITHGNRYFVKRSLEFLKERVIDENIDFVCFGHTHNRLVERSGMTTFINPGSFYPNADKKSCGVILEIKNKNDYQLNDLIIE